MSPDEMPPLTLEHLDSIDVLELRRNLGHQRAITVGLCHLEEQGDAQVVIVMDGDGEDEPKDVLTLLARCEQEGFAKAVFAGRRRRLEGLFFKVGYQMYRGLHRVLTGLDIRVGNFSAIPERLLRRLVVVSELWNHYAAGLIKARVPYVEVPLDRGHRLAGASKMSFVALVVHGLSAISVYSETAGVRMLVAAFGMIVSALIAMCVVIGIRIWTNLAVPGWSSYLAVLFFLIVIQSVSLALVFVFTVLSARNNFSFLPLRDYRHFILRQHRIASR
jgi:glycosyltransferase involved in cell wall biosynthesis